MAWEHKVVAAKIVIYTADMVADSFIITNLDDES